MTFFSYGDPGVLRITDVDRPAPGPGEVLVAVGASSVNGHDTLVRAGAMTMVSGRRLPLGAGLDFAGTVVGGALPAGTPVWGTVHPRDRHVVAGAAEYVVVRVGVRPAGLTAVDAAALVVPGMTALQALRAATGLAAGESVLVRGAAGGVSEIAAAHAAFARRGVVGRQIVEVA